jgi:NTE family protein
MNRDIASILCDIEPVRSSSEAKSREPEPGTALCLSGGGYRAMLFHTGALWRLNELGLLAGLNLISCVSGGSIAAGVLATRWRDLEFDGSGVSCNFLTLVVAPIRALASRTLDIPAVLKGLFLPGSVADYVASAYRRHLFGRKSLQDLPDNPRFVFNATSLQSGVLWRFSKSYMGDYRVGRVFNPTVELSAAVAASSAFPPVLSPALLKLDPKAFSTGSGERQPRPVLSRAVLTDGGVYDNLGLETAWKRYKTILVSDGGEGPTFKPEPRINWIAQSIRVRTLMSDQIGSLRKRQVIGSFKLKLREGAYWGICSDIRNYGLADTLACPLPDTLEIARTPTRLAKLELDHQEKIIDWGYAVCDAALRAHVLPSAQAPSRSPYGAFKK